MRQVSSRIGSIVKQHRKVLRLSQKVLAEQAEVSRYVIRQIEGGHVLALPEGKLRRIASALQIQVDELLEQRRRASVVGLQRVRKGRHASYHNLVALLKRGALFERPVRLLRIGASSRFRDDVMAEVDPEDPQRGLNETTRLLLDRRIPSIEFLMADPFGEPLLTREDTEGLSGWRILRVRQQMLAFAKGLLHLRAKQPFPKRLRVAMHVSPLVWNLGILGEEEILLRAYGRGSGHDGATTDLLLETVMGAPIAESFLRYYEAVRSSRSTRQLRSEADLRALVRRSRWPSLYKGNAVRAAADAHSDFDDDDFPVDDRVYKVCLVPEALEAESRWLGLERRHRRRCRSFHPPRLIRKRDVPWRGLALEMERITGPSLFELAASLRAEAGRGEKRRPKAGRLLGLLTAHALAALREFQARAGEILPEEATVTYPYRRRLREALRESAPLLREIQPETVSAAGRDLARLGRSLERIASLPFRDAHLKNRLLASGRSTARSTARRLLRQGFEKTVDELSESTRDIDFESTRHLVTAWDDTIHVLLFEHTVGAKATSVAEVEAVVREWLGPEALAGAERDRFWKTVLGRSFRELCRRIWYARVMPLTYGARYGLERRDHFLRLATMAAGALGAYPDLRFLLEAIGALGDEAWGTEEARTLAPPLVGEPPPGLVRKPLAGAGPRVRESVDVGKGLVLLAEENRLFLRGAEVRFTPLQFKALLALARRPGSFVSSRDLCDAMWDAPTDEVRVKKVVHQIRQRLARLVRDGIATREEIDGLIESRWGAGYALHSLDGKPLILRRPGPK